MQTESGKPVIYLDNAATTKVHPLVLEAMLPWFCGAYANPGSPYSFAAQPKKAVEDARSLLASCIGAEPFEICFTSGATEANNMAVKGFLHANPADFILSPIEHSSIMTIAKALFKSPDSRKVFYTRVSQEGVVDLESLEEYCRYTRLYKNRIPLVSILMASNEIGTIEPVRQISEIVHRYNGVFHCDCTQAFGQIPIHVKAMGIDMLSMSGHKIGAPKGIGFLYIRRGLILTPLIHGAQENHMRGGTENVPYIAGLAKAASLLPPLPRTSLADKRDAFLNRIFTLLPHIRLNGSKTNRLPGNIHLFIPGTEGEALQMELDMANICIATQSACQSGSLKPSHVLTATGMTEEDSHCCIRLSLHEDNTEEELDTAAKALAAAVLRLGNPSSPPL